MCAHPAGRRWPTRLATYGRTAASSAGHPPRAFRPDSLLTSWRQRWPTGRERSPAPRLHVQPGRGRRRLAVRTLRSAEVGHPGPSRPASQSATTDDEHAVASLRPAGSPDARESVWAHIPGPRSAVQIDPAAVGEQLAPLVPGRSSSMAARLLPRRSSGVELRGPVRCSAIQTRGPIGNCGDHSPGPTTAIPSRGPTVLVWARRRSRPSFDPTRSRPGGDHGRDRDGRPHHLVEPPPGRTAPVAHRRPTVPFRTDPNHLPVSPVPPAEQRSANVRPSAALR